MVGKSHDETNLYYTLFLTNTTVSKIRKVFENGSSANIKFSKTQLPKMVQLRGFVGRFLGPLLKNSLPLIGNVSH